MNIEFEVMRKREFLKTNKMKNKKIILWIYFDDTC